jgi:hypothetical protein
MLADDAHILIASVARTQLMGAYAVWRREITKVQCQEILTVIRV